MDKMDETLQKLVARDLEIKDLKAELEKARTERQFPVLGKVGPSSVPWSWVMSHENSVKNQHYQSVERMASRGGMDVVELYYAMRDEMFPWNLAKDQWPKEQRKALDWIETKPWLKNKQNEGG